VQAILNYFKEKSQNLIVIHDDVDLTLGKIKIQKNISSAGHKGIKSIIQQIGTQDFTRLRLGIAKDKKDKQGDTARYVLKNFNLLEKRKLKKLKEQVLAEVKNLQAKNLDA
jgi:PTH1 family peptidyl-tRNA hydrolase